MSMIVGFQTSAWLYEFDASGRVHRHRSMGGLSAPGNRGWSAWGHAVFVPHTHPMDICAPGEDITLVYTAKDGKPRPMPFSNSFEALPLPAIHGDVAIMRTDATGVIAPLRPAFAHPPEKLDPARKWIPVMMIFSADDEGVTTSIGQPITGLFRTKDEIERILNPAATQSRLQLVPRRAERGLAARASLA